MNNPSKVDLDWSTLSFSYIQTELRFRAEWRNGQWNDGRMEEDPFLRVHEGSTALHYGQECFEGMKAFAAADGRVLLFRPDENARRMQRSAVRIMMPKVPEELFMRGVTTTVQANRRWVPPYGSGASLYIRPLLFGMGPNIGVRPASEYMFTVFCTPVGPYFKGGLKPVFLSVSDFDRAAPKGTGAAKVGGNYAASLQAHHEAVEAGYADCIYLDPVHHRNIEEVGAANFFGITRDNRLVTPKSPSILPSITRMSLVHIAREMLGMTVEERDIPIDSIDEFIEAGACGTAAVITPIGGIFHNGSMHRFYADGNEVGPVIRRLYDTLRAIQLGDRKGPEGWVVEVPLENPAD